MNFDVRKPTYLYVDHGPGKVASTVAQGHKDKEGKLIYHPVYHNCCVLMETEQRYSKVEGESLAVLYGIYSNKIYQYGTRFYIVVDHKPLVSLYNSLGRPSPVRVDQHRSELLGFDFSVIFYAEFKNSCDYPSCYHDPCPNISMLTELEKHNLGLEDKVENSKFSINRVVMEGDA